VYDKAARIAQKDGAWDITGLSGQELMAVQDVLARGLTAGWSERSFAQALKPILGLGPRFEVAVASYQNRLSIAGRSRADIKRLTDAYADSLRRYRANLVAEYELRTALGQAQRDYWRDRQAQGLLGKNAVRVFRCHKDERTCDVCRSLDGRRTPVSSDDNAPPMHPNCRCWEVCADRGVVKKLWLPDNQIEEVAKAYNPAELRDPEGEWTRGGLHLPVKKWVDPPEPKGMKGQHKAGGLTAIGITNTELGDAVEAALVAHMGMHYEHPTTDRRGPLDVTIGKDSYEVKSAVEEATEYKAKPRAAEVARKIAYAKQQGLVPHTMVVVYSEHERKIYVYSKEGIGAYRLTSPENGWSFHGTVPLYIEHHDIVKWLSTGGWDLPSHTGRMLAEDFRCQEVSKKVLSTEDRKKIPKSQFAIPEKAPGPGSYPIHDLAHAKNALSRVSQHGTSEEQARVRKAVYRSYPELKGNGNGYADTEKSDRLVGFRYPEMILKDWTAWNEAHRGMGRGRAKKRPDLSGITNPEERYFASLHGKDPRFPNQVTFVKKPKPKEKFPRGKGYPKKTPPKVEFIPPHVPLAPNQLRPM
jgi:SPP1 gp7 family putative phage head morphogenesis protein